MKLTRSERRWILLALTTVLLAMATKPLPYTRLWVPVVLIAFLVPFLKRFLKHTGGHYFSGINQTAEERAEEEKRNTGEIPVIEPTAISEPVRSLSPVTPVRSSVWTSARVMTFSIALALVIQGLSAFSKQRLEQAREIEKDNDELLGIPGAWNGYAPTQASMGTRGWGPEDGSA